MNTYYLFCQAPADIPHILKKHDELSIEKGAHIEICCFNSIACYDCLASLNLNAIIKYIPFFVFPFKKKVWNLLFLQSIAISKLSEQDIWKKDVVIYFTSIYDDPSTAFYLHLFHKKMQAKLNYLNHYDNNQNITVATNVTKKEYVVRLLLKYFTGICFEYRTMSNRWNVLRFPKECYEIIEHKPNLDLAVCRKYAYHINNKTSKAVLLFASPNREQKFISDEEYMDLHVRIVNYLKDKGYMVYVKGHPRIGTPIEISSIVDGEIPQYISSELIELSDFSLCVGFITIALASAAKMKIIPVFSFLPLASNTHSDIYDSYLSYIEQSGDGSIKLIHSLDDLTNV